MLSPPPDRTALRWLLEKIPTDPDFDAFCIDYFPDVHRRFGADMDRVAKINLLLLLQPDMERIATNLRERFPALPKPEVARSTSWRLCLVIGLGSAGLVAVGLAGYLVNWKGSPPASVGPPAADASAEPARAPLPNAAADLPPPAGTIVDHAGDIRAQGSVNIGAPPTGEQTLVKTRGQIQAGGDVQIGVTAPAPPGRRKEKERQ